MIVQGEAPGSIPKDAHLTLEGRRLEMVGSHVFQGKWVHPLTIPIPDETARRLRETGHQGQWILRTVSNRRDGRIDLHLEAAGPEETIPDPRDQPGQQPQAREEPRTNLRENRPGMIRISQSQDQLEKLAGHHGTADDELASWERVLRLRREFSQPKGTADEKPTRIFEITEGRKAESEPDPDSPSQTLYEHLKGYPWFLSVGRGNGKLIIYTRKHDPMASRVIPEEWEGLPVMMRNVGTIRPT